MNEELKSTGRSVFNTERAFAGLILLMPVMTFAAFQISYLYNYYDRQSVEAIILSRTCFLEQGSGRHGQTSTRYLSCKDMRRELEENEKNLEGRKRYVDAGRVAVV